MTAIDVDRLRADTPGVANVVHFNNAGDGLMPAPVLAAQQAHLTREAEIGGYEAADEARARLDAVYGSVARLIGARPDEIALVESATRAWGAAFHALDWRDGDRIVTGEAEYASNYIAFLQLQKRTRIDIAVARSDVSGQTDPADVDRLIDGRTRLVSTVHVPTNGGLVNPVSEIGAVARAHGVPHLVDACQSAGQIDLDVRAMGCDMLSVTGRKYLRGPRGTGFLYVATDILDRLDPPFLDTFGADWVEPGRYEMRAGARRFENFESHVAGRIGLGVAVDYALDIGMPEIEARVTALGGVPQDGAVSGAAGRRHRYWRNPLRHRHLRPRQPVARRNKRRSARARHQHIGHNGHQHASGHAAPRAPDARPRIGALLQHGRGDRALLRGCCRPRPGLIR